MNVEEIIKNTCLEIQNINYLDSGMNMDEYCNLCDKIKLKMANEILDLVASNVNAGPRQM